MKQEILKIFSSQLPVRERAEKTELKEARENEVKRVRERYRSAVCREKKTKRPMVYRGRTKKRERRRGGGV